MRRRDLLCVALGVAVFGCGSSAAEQVPAPDASRYEGCSVSALTLPSTQVGRANKLSARVVAAAPNPPAKHENTWTLQVGDANGAPLDGAEIVSVETFMPVHEHAGEPEPTAEPDSAGTFRMRLHFMMRGPWEVRIDLASPQAGEDRVVFDVCVAE